MSQLLWISGFLLTSGLVAVHSANYKFQLMGEEFLLPCEDFPDNFVDKWFDISKLKIDQYQNYTIVVRGGVIFTKEVPQNRPIQLTANIFKKTRGTWTNTLYNLKYPDFCESVFEPKSFWYQYRMMVRKEFRKCPLMKNTIADNEMSAEALLKHVPVRNGEGSYRGVVMLSYGQRKDEFVCFMMHGDAYKV